MKLQLYFENVRLRISADLDYFTCFRSYYELLQYCGRFLSLYMHWMPSFTEERSLIALKSMFLQISVPSLVRKNITMVISLTTRTQPNSGMFKPPLRWEFLKCHSSQSPCALHPSRSKIFLYLKTSLEDRTHDFLVGRQEAFGQHIDFNILKTD